MEIHNADRRKRKKALKKVMKENIKNLNGGIKFCYGLTIFLRATAIILGIVTIMYILIVSQNLLDLILLIIAFGGPYLLSFIPAALYVNTTQKEYRFRGKEVITTDNEGFVYSYYQDVMGMQHLSISYKVRYSQIEKVEFLDKANIIKIFGKIEFDNYDKGKVINSNSCKQVEFLDIYDISIKELLEGKLMKEQLSE